MSIPTKDSLKQKAKTVRKFLNDKYQVDVSHGHCMEIISQALGFKDWNTASAALKPKLKQDDLPLKLKTVGDLKKALELFDDSAAIDGDYEFKVKDFMDEIEHGDLDGTIHQEFSLILNSIQPDDIVSFQLELEHESISHTL